MRPRHTIAALTGVAVLVTTIAARQAPQRPSAFAPEGITPVSLGLAGYAKVLCSAVFVSERDRLSLDLFMADASSGVVLRKVISTAADPHFDSLQYIQSAGAWDATGRRFVVAAVIDGIASLTIVDTKNVAPRRDIRLRDLGEIYNPSWSPDGKQIVFDHGLGEGQGELVVINADGTGAHVITTDPSELAAQHDEIDLAKTTEGE